MMKTRLMGAIFWFLILFPAYVRGEVYQWVDGRGVIHFTDNLHSVPGPVRGSPGLIIREDIDSSGSGEIFLIPDENVVFEPVGQPQDREAVAPPEPEKAAPPTNIFYSPQQTIVVINSTVIHPRKRACRTPGGCQGAFRPNFNDRRYIHPSVFDGGSRQYIRPESARPTPR